jgi:hypothetical protein
MHVIFAYNIYVKLTYIQKVHKTGIQIRTQDPDP